MMSDVATMRVVESVDDSAANLEYLSPEEVVLDANVRSKPRLPSEFVESVRERGVIVPVLAWRNPLGQVMVIDGQRRLLAARKAELSTIPVLLVDGPNSVYSRISDQLLLNEARDSLSVLERADAVRQLELFGLNQRQIAKRAGLKQKTVRELMRVADSEVSRQVVEEVPEVDVVAAARLAALEESDFFTEEDFAKVVDELRTSPSHVEYYLAKAEGEVKSRQAVEVLREQCESVGIRVVDDFEGFPNRSPLTHLVDKRTGQRLDADEHRVCPGHLELVRSDNDGGATTDAYCEDPKKYGHCASWEYRGVSVGSNGEPLDDEAAAEAKRAERRETIEKNKESDAARTVRIGFIKDMLFSSILPSQWERFVASAAATGWYSDSGWELASPEKLLREVGYLKEEQTLRDLAGKDNRGGSRVLLAAGLAECEASMPRDCWRTSMPLQRLYLEQLQAWGFTLSPFEEAILKREQDEVGL